MTCYDFTTIATTKWILVGEHAVLRNKPAIAVPFKKNYIKLFYRNSPSFKIVSRNEKLSIAANNLLQLGAQYLKLESQISGEFFFQFNLPACGGLGVSAALCVVIARFFNFKKFITSAAIYSLAQHLEHSFHGSSSGLDIAAIIAQTAILFKNNSWQKLAISWQPKFSLTSCIGESTTQTCINKVKSLIKHAPHKALEIDAQMERAVLAAKAALSNENMHKLAVAINLAADCFQAWGLVSNQLRTHMDNLREQGAIAVKPTGAGLNGYVLSLWDTNHKIGNTAHLF